MVHFKYFTLLGSEVTNWKKKLSESMRRVNKITCIKLKNHSVEN